MGLLLGCIVHPLTLAVGTSISDGIPMGVPLRCIVVHPMTSHGTSHGNSYPARISRGKSYRNFLGEILPPTGLFMGLTEFPGGNPTPTGLLMGLTVNMSCIVHPMSSLGTSHGFPLWDILRSNRISYRITYLWVPVGSHGTPMGAAMGFTGYRVKPPTRRPMGRSIRYHGSSMGRLMGNHVLRNRQCAHTAY